MKFILPQGIGDSVWALHKIQAAAEYFSAANSIEVYLNCCVENEVENRALDFVRRFKFVKRAFMLPGFNIHPHQWLDPEGRYIYIQDGLTTFTGEVFFVLMPNGHLERGHRLEEWLPEFHINWDIMNDFQISEDEHKSAVEVKKELGDYVVFYLGPLRGNTDEGHNRKGLWSPEDWRDLGNRIHEEFGLQILIVGAPYDELYYQCLLQPIIPEPHWHSIIGETNVGQLYAITKGSKFVISYQSGVGIVSNYLDVPVGIFWRPKGDSINPDFYLSFEETMASAWANPRMIASRKHLPLIYGRHSVSYIMDQIKERRWVDGRTDAKASTS